MRAAALLGSGASRGTFETFHVPVAAEFGTALTKIDHSWRQNYQGLMKVVEHLRLDPGNWCLEPVWSCIDYYEKLETALPLPKPWKDAGKELKKALLAVYGQRCDKAPAPATDSTLVRLLEKELQAGDALVSFNYDTIVERTAQNCDRRVLAAPYGGQQSLRFAKPHGSASWTLDVRSCCVTWLSPDGSPLLDSLLLDDVDCGKEPLLLGAVPIKSELLKEVQHY